MNSEPLASNRQLRILLALRKANAELDIFESKDFTISDAQIRWYGYDPNEFTFTVAADLIESEMTSLKYNISKFGGI